MVAPIEQELEIKMPVRTVGEYLKWWSFTQLKPVKQAYERTPQAVWKWLDEAYPEIKEGARAEGPEIDWGDEAGVRRGSQHQRGDALKGKTPVIRLNARRTFMRMISAITQQGKARCKVFEGTPRLRPACLLRQAAGRSGTSGREKFWMNLCRASLILFALFMDKRRA